MKHLPLLLLIYPLYQFYQLYLTNRKHKRKMKAISDWSDFNKQTLDWADEIKDDKVKNLLADFLFEKISLYTNDNAAVVYEFDINKSKQEIIDKFGKHIPSLLIEVRDEKIDEILNK